MISRVPSIPMILWFCENTCQKKLIGKRCEKKTKQNSRRLWEMETASKSHNSKHNTTILKGLREKLQSSGNWFYNSSNDHNFGELGDFCSDSHKALDIKEHVSRQYHVFRKSHWAITAFSLNCTKSFLPSTVFTGIIDCNFR